MEYITPYNRSQIEFSSLDDLVEYHDNQENDPFMQALAKGN